MTIFTVCLVIMIVFCLFSDHSIMSDYQDQVPFINSPSSGQPGQGSQGFHDYNYEDPFEGSESEDSMEDGRVNDNPHHSRWEEVTEPPPSQAG